MQFERLVIDADTDSFTLDFHDRLTVIASLGSLEREGLINELVGALGNSRSGVHLEMASDAGNRFAIFRPAGARHRVVDIDTAEDVSARYRSSDGSIDLLARAGLNVRTAKRRMRLTPDDLHTASESDRYIRQLASVAQGRLWELADKVFDRKRQLDLEADATGSAPEDAAAVARIEELHREAEAAQAELERVRTWSLWGSFGLIMAALPVAMAAGFFAALPFILAAVFAGVISLQHYRRAEAADKAEEDALSAIGANNYLNFHLQRVNRLLTSDHGRKRLMSAAEEHRVALAEWALLAGDITVEWATDHQDEIRAAALNTRGRVGLVVPTTSETDGAEVREIAGAVETRLAQARTMGPGGESFPVLMDEPFGEVHGHAKLELMADLRESGGRQQVVYLTDDPEIAAWARAEAASGSLSIIEPPAETTGTTPSDPSVRARVAV